MDRRQLRSFIVSIRCERHYTIACVAKPTAVKWQIWVRIRVTHIAVETETREGYRLLVVEREVEMLIHRGGGFWGVA